MELGGPVILLNFRSLIPQASRASFNWFDFGLTLFDIAASDLESTKPEERRRMISSETLSHENVDMIKQWINDCIQNHPTYILPPSQWVPTRLLEIDGTGASHIRLIETSSRHLQTGCRFAALNHVWGDKSVSPPLRALQSNLHQLKQDIRISDLPRNFIDAVRVSIQLGIRYIWIDSLCIVQDSEQDWKREAQTMHLVYSYAVLTIAATSAASSHDGFLDRNIATATLAAKIAYPVSYQHAAADFEAGDDGEGSWGSDNNYMIISHRGPADDYHQYHAISYSKWNTRAWTMQERSLSSRIIHFCKNKLFFECRSCLKSEENEPTQEHDRNVMWPRDASMSHGDIYEHWEVFVYEYSVRKLTNSNDKLIAIQSVAAEIVAVTNWDYIRFAGMWRHKLINELRWSAMEASRPNKSRAPSWSWAAVDGPILLINTVLSSVLRSVPEWFDPLFLQHHFQVVDMGSYLPGYSSEDNHGYLEVKTWVKRISCIKREASSEIWRTFFPYDLISTDSRRMMDEATDAMAQEYCFAHARLDIDMPKPEIRPK